MRYLGVARIILRGDEAAASGYITQARTFLGLLHQQDIVLGGNKESWRTVRLNSRVTIELYASRVLPPQIRITVIPEPSEFEVSPSTVLLLAAWRPEGICFTPRAASLPDGIGLPHRNFLDTGEVLSSYTPGGAYPQVIINRFRNNAYLDSPDGLSGTEFAADAMNGVPYAGTRDAYATDIEPWDLSFGYTLHEPNPLSYGEVPQAGVYEGRDFWADTANSEQFPFEAGEYVLEEKVEDGRPFLAATLKTPQRDDNDQPVIFEAQTPEWHGHRPEELLYPTVAHETVFQESNILRLVAGEVPVLRHLRGDGNMAAVAVGEVVISGDFSHNSADFRPGLEDIGSRGLNALSTFEAAGENLAIGAAFDGLTEQVGKDLVDAWEVSTYHRDNIINDLWSLDSDDQTQGALQIAYATGTIDRRTEPLPLPPIPSDPVSGGVWAQNFYKKTAWVAMWDHYVETDFGPIGWNGTGNPVDNNPLWAEQSFTPIYIGFRNIQYPVPNSFCTDDIVRVLAVSVYRFVNQQQGINELRFRVAVWRQPFDNTQPYDERYGRCTITIWTAPVGLCEPLDANGETVYRPNAAEPAWEVEDELVFDDQNYDDYLFPAFATAAVSPDGEKFCFTMQRYETEAQRFCGLWNRSVTELQRVHDKAVVRFVFIEKTATGDFDFLPEQPVPTATIAAANLNNTFINALNSYERTLNVTLDYYPYYERDATSGTIERKFVRYSINDYQNQGSTSYLWRERKLIFGSGKEVLLEYFWMNGATSRTRAEMTALNIDFPVPPDEDECFTSTLLHMDPLTEDVVLVRNYCTQLPFADVFFSPQSPTLSVFAQPGVVSQVKSTVLADLGTQSDRDQVVVVEREQLADVTNWQSTLTDDQMTFLDNKHADITIEPLGREEFAAIHTRDVIPTQNFFRYEAGPEFSDDAGIARSAKEIIDMPEGTDYQAVWDGRKAFAATTNVRLGTCGQIYSYTAPWVAGRSTDIGVFHVWEFDSRMGPTTEWYSSESEVLSALGTGGGNLRPRALNPSHMTNRADVHSRPHVKDYSPSMFHAMPRTSRWHCKVVGSVPMMAGLTNQGEEFVMDNVAPNVENNWFNAPVKLVRYEDRVLLRLSHDRRLDWLLGTQSSYEDAAMRFFFELESRASAYRVDQFESGDEVDSEARVNPHRDVAQRSVIVWANFDDLDTLAGMADVTDIDPFGRVI